MNFRLLGTFRFSGDKLYIIKFYIYSISIIRNKNRYEKNIEFEVKNFQIYFLINKQHVRIEKMQVKNALKN